MITRKTNILPVGFFVFHRESSLKTLKTSGGILDKKIFNFIHNIVYVKEAIRII